MTDRRGNPVGVILDRRDPTQHCPLTDVTKEDEVVEWMYRLGVSCGNLGAHASGRLPMHHHHDMACLVEAGAADPTRHAKVLGQRLRDEKDHSARQHEQIEELQVDRGRLAAQSMRMREFMAHTPDVAPYDNVLQAFAANETRHGR